MTITASHKCICCWSEGRCPSRPPQWSPSQCGAGEPRSVSHLARDLDTAVCILTKAVRMGGRDKDFGGYFWGKFSQKNSSDSLSRGEERGVRGGGDGFWEAEKQRSKVNVVVGGWWVVREDCRVNCI